MDDGKKIYVIQHIFDHFYFKQLQLNSNDSVIWIIPHAYIVNKMFLIESFWLGKGFLVKMWPTTLVYVNSLNLFGLYNTKLELMKSLKFALEIHLVDKSSVFSQLVLDLHDNVSLHQFSEYNDFRHKLNLNIIKTAYQIVLTLFFGIKLRVIKGTSSGNRRFDSYPYEGKNFKIVDIKFHQHRSNKAHKESAVFFGSRFLQWGLNNDELNKISLKLKIIANKKYKTVYYIPHPLEVDGEFFFCKNQIQNLQLVGKDIISAEDWATNFSVDELDTYSIGSTASKITSQLGYNSTVFYRDIFERSETVNEYDKLFHMSEVQYR